jgi:hypothetical protein
MNNQLVGEVLRALVGEFLRAKVVGKGCRCKDSLRPAGPAPRTAGGTASAVGSCNVKVEGYCTGGGVICFVVNADTVHSVVATVRVNWTQGIDSGSYQFSVQLPAGGKQYLGCTNGGGFPDEASGFYRDRM